MATAGVTQTFEKGHIFSLQYIMNALIKDGSKHMPHNVLSVLVHYKGQNTKERIICTFRCLHIVTAQVSLPGNDTSNVINSFALQCDALTPFSNL